MQPQELRIGNIFWEPDSKQYVEIIGIKKAIKAQNFGYIHYATLDGDGPFGIDGIRPVEPVPVTREILIAAGFEQDGPSSPDIYVFNDMVVFLNGAPISDIFDPYISLGWRGGVIVVKHLHRLQNLYYSLTGQELTIILPSHAT